MPGDKNYGRFRRMAFWVGNFSIGFVEEFREFNKTNSTNTTAMVKSTMKDISTFNVKELEIESMPKYVRRIGRAGAVLQGAKSFAQTPVGNGIVVAITNASPTLKFM